MAVYALNLFNIADRDEYLAYSQAVLVTEVANHGGKVDRARRLPATRWPATSRPGGC